MKRPFQNITNMNQQASNKMKKPAVSSCIQTRHQKKQELSDETRRDAVCAVYDLVDQNQAHSLVSLGLFADQMSQSAQTTPNKDALNRAFDNLDADLTSHEYTQF